MVSQQTIDIIIRAEDRATAALEKVESQLSKVRNLALGLNNSFNTASNGANRLGTNLNKVNPASLRRVNEISLQLQAALLIVARNIQAVQNAMGRTNGSNFKQIESNVKQLDTTLVATKGSANQLDRAFDTIDARAIKVVDAQAIGLKERLLTIIPSAEEVKTALKNIGNVNFNGLNEKIDGVKSHLTGLGSSSKTATNGFSGLNVGSRLAGAGLGFLRNAASMTVGMIGYDLFNSVMESGRAAINASGQLQYFGSRLGMSGAEVKSFSNELDGLQSEFKKVNMHAVGAAAEEMAVKLNLGKNSVKELTEVTAVMSSAFVKEGRTQEDAILAVSDAMDGQFRRLQEIGISQDMLMQNGWNGDLQDKDSLLKAMNKTLKEMGFTQTAKDITNLDDAYQALTVSGGILMEKILVPITPLLLSMAEAAMGAFDYIGGAIEGLGNAWNGLPDWAKDTLGVTAFTLALTALAIFISVSLIPTITGGLLSAMTSLGTIFGITILPTASLSGAFMVLAGAIWAALAPLLPFIAAAVIAAVAIYEVGKAFGWWTDVGSMIDAIKNNIGRLWDAFINHPDVQGTIKAIGDAWNWLCDALKPVVDWLKGIWDEMFPESAKGKVDGTRIIIEAIGKTWEAMTFPIRTVISVLQFLWGVFGNVCSAIQSAQSQFGAFGGFLATIGAPIIFVYELLKKIVCILLGCSPGIVPALEKTWEIFQTVFNAIAGFIGSIISPIVEAIRPLIDIFVEIVAFMVEAFMPVWNLLSTILTIIWNNVTLLIQVFEMFLTGQITLPQMLSMIWNIIMTTFMTILTMIVNFVLAWAGQIIGAAISAATGFVNGIISYISSLPGRFLSYLSQTTGNIISAGAQWVSSACQKAGEMVDGAATTVQELPGKIYTEFSKVPDRIRDALPAAIQAAINFGSEIIKGILNAMGIHSPGIVQNSIAEEIKNTVTKIKDAIQPAGEYATQLGNEIVEKFGSPQLDLKTEDLLPYTDLDADKFENVDFGSMDMDFSGMSSGLDESIGLTDETNTMIGESYAALALLMSETLNGMVLNDQLAYGQIQSNDLATFQAITNGLNLNLLLMSTNLRTQLNNMLLTHRTAMMNATITTQQQLSIMLNETMRVTAEMRSAWAVMADSIISAAARIKNEATSYFNQLASTIGDFYRKLQNPAQWGGSANTGSPSRVRHTGRDPAVMTRLTRGVANNLRRDNQLPYTIPAVEARERGMVTPVTLEYMNKTSSDRINLVDLLQRGACPNCFAGAWEDVADPNIAYIKATAREWDMKGPAVHTGAGDIDTGLSFKVKDFEDGSAHISWSSFVNIATAIASAIPYDFYYNSDKYGSWQNAIAHGAWNCYDGASAMVALANTCGFSGYVDCGLNWGNVGHCAAVINGYTFDTTSMANRGGWASGPCNYSHPAPSAGGPINIKFPGSRSVPRTHTNPLEGLFDNNNGSSGGSEEVKLTLEHNVNVHVDGNTEEIDTNALVAELTDSVTDKSLIDRIADALIKRDKRIARMGGA